MPKQLDLKGLADRLEDYVAKKLTSQEVKQLRGDLQALLHDDQKLGSDLADAIRQVLIDLNGKVCAR